MGLKENIIIGKLIPAGTGMERYREFETLAPDYEPMEFWTSEDDTEGDDLASSLATRAYDGDGDGGVAVWRRDLATTQGGDGHGNGAAGAGNGSSGADVVDLPVRGRRRRGRRPGATIRLAAAAPPQTFVPTIQQLVRKGRESKPEKGKTAALKGPRSDGASAPASTRTRRRSRTRRCARWPECD